MRVLFHRSELPFLWNPAEGQSNLPMPLSGIAIFRDIDQSELQAISRFVKSRKYRAGEILIGADDESSEVYFIISGRIRVRRHLINGREVIFSDLYAGATLGEYAALDHANRSTDAFAVEASLVGIMQENMFHQMLLTYPRVCLNLAINLARVSRQSLRRIVDLSSMTAAQRVCRELLDMSEAVILQDPDRMMTGGLGHLYTETALDQSLGPVILSDVPSQSVIAARVATSRETVSRVLTQLDELGVIRRVRRSTISVLDLRQLRHIVGGEKPFDIT